MIGGDVMDKDEIDNGKRREGVYAGINSLITKPAGSIATALFPLMLTGLYHFDDSITLAGTNNHGIDDSVASFIDGCRKIFKAATFPVYCKLFFANFKCINSRCNSIIHGKFIS